MSEVLRIHIEWRVLLTFVRVTSVRVDHYRKDNNKDYNIDITCIYIYIIVKTLKTKMYPFKTKRWSIWARIYPQNMGEPQFIRFIFIVVFFSFVYIFIYFLFLTILAKLKNKLSDSYRIIIFFFFKFPINLTICIIITGIAKIHERFQSFLFSRNELLFYDSRQFSFFFFNLYCIYKINNFFFEFI